MADEIPKIEVLAEDPDMRLLLLPRMPQEDGGSIFGLALQDSSLVGCQFITLNAAEWEKVKTKIDTHIKSLTHN